MAVRAQRGARVAGGPAGRTPAVRRFTATRAAAQRWWLACDHDDFAFDLDSSTAGPSPGRPRHVNGTWLRTGADPHDKASTGALPLSRGTRPSRRCRSRARAWTASRRRRRAAPRRKSRRLPVLHGHRADRGAGVPSRCARTYAVAIDSPRALAPVGTATRRGIGAALHIDLDSDPVTRQRNLVFVGQSGLGLPDQEIIRAGAVRADP
ncbi:hypothetical protein QJS66_16470 [Kocuria rhizophila]|nr:hypothetical protein QJS66_16470 [Kocuria rhizophila]